MYCSRSGLAQLQECIRVLDGAEVGSEPRSPDSDSPGVTEAASDRPSSTACHGPAHCAHSDWHAFSTAHRRGSRHLSANESDQPGLWCLLRCDFSNYRSL